MSIPDLLCEDRVEEDMRHFQPLHRVGFSEDRARVLGIREFALKPLAKRDIAALIRKVLDVDTGPQNIAQ